MRWLKLKLEAVRSAASGAAEAGQRGLPPGSPVSTLLAHLCLDTFDEALRARGLRLVRSGDGFVVLVRDLGRGLPSPKGDRR